MCWRTQGNQCWDCRRCRRYALRRCRTSRRSAGSPIVSPRIVSTLIATAGPTSVSRRGSSSRSCGSVVVGRTESVKPASSAAVGSAMTTASDAARTEGTILNTKRSLPVSKADDQEMCLADGAICVCMLSNRATRERLTDAHGRAGIAGRDCGLRHGAPPHRPGVSGYLQSRHRLLPETHDENS